MTPTDEFIAMLERFPLYSASSVSSAMQKFRIFRMGCQINFWSESQMATDDADYAEELRGMIEIFPF
jgi:hypothetical protein